MGCRCELDQAGSGHALAEIHHAVWTGCDGSEHRGSACPTDGHRAADSKRLPTLSPPYRVIEKLIRCWRQSGHTGFAYSTRRLFSDVRSRAALLTIVLYRRSSIDADVEVPSALRTAAECLSCDHFQVFFFTHRVTMHNIII